MGPAGGERRPAVRKAVPRGFQSGLAWITILRKRENFRKAFLGFEIDKVAAMGEADIERLVLDAGIIRHRGKIASTINNAKRTQEIRKEFGSLAAYIWRFEPEPVQGPVTMGQIPAQTDGSKALSKDLRKRGFSFVGPTTVYAFMQAMGLVNDHVDGCFCRGECEAERAKLKRPKASSAGWRQHPRSCRRSAGTHPEVSETKPRYLRMAPRLRRGAPWLMRGACRSRLRPLHQQGHDGDELHALAQQLLVGIERRRERSRLRGRRRKRNLNKDIAFPDAGLPRRLLKR